ncbi:50S ribosomal protein L24 [Candidatus Beckwithbacteria bacterium CG23_combo_of_CG06-09_8_20_14_all_34_8]|uniref:Large ribosomal subunit protein uL24 n=1 Tax=Candidatus Beckwithbacteria bacterium CG23_combo_of_CG06-09_8_20_14_all_34_8 TaxID=1974497 RepID=A0A2H0B6V1_9BACT|nr:MAG: 50S ribosomal protein L24 [Candidatus Beckwithbacteria bacterium CG23_combo_of_CG06-09_8_20_14_all_34_8]
MKQIITKAKIKKGDTVTINTGKDAGKKGMVEKVFIANSRILIKGVNIVKKHVKPKGKNQPGQIISLEKPISLSNATLICPNCNKATRVGYKIINKNKQRICKKCKQVIETKKTESNKTSK